MNMQTYIKSSLLYISVFFYCFSFAQKDFQVKAYYQSKTTVDMSNFGGGQLSEERKKQISERIKSAFEKTYTLTFNQSESMYEEEEKLDAPGQGGGMRFGMMNATGGLLYKNIKEQKLSQEQELLGKQFLIQDSLPTLQWELGSETKMIGQYLCFKATAVKIDDTFDFSRFRRRNEPENTKDSTKTTTEQVKEIPKQIIVTAWYTPQIPVNQGPGEYWGLPGLILEVNADRTTILCSKIILNPTNKVEIKVPSKGKNVSKAEYDSIVKEKMEEMREMYRSRGGARGPRG